MATVGRSGKFRGTELPKCAKAVRCGRASVTWRKQVGAGAAHDNDEAPLIRNTWIRRVDAERGGQRDEMILLVDQDAAQAFGDRVFV